MSMCSISSLGLSNLRQARIICRQLSFAPHWTAGSRLRDVKLECKTICLDPEWTPSDKLLYSLQFGPIYTSELETNPTLELLKTWKGLNLSIAVDRQLKVGPNQIVKAVRDKLYCSESRIGSKWVSGERGVTAIMLYKRRHWAGTHSKLGLGLSRFAKACNAV